MLTKNETIVIIEKALANPNYLGADNGNEKPTHLFCSSVLQVLQKEYGVMHELIEDTLQEICQGYIYPSINESLFLKTHLFATGKIEYGVSWDDPEYKTAARTHWVTLIQSLKDSEQ